MNKLIQTLRMHGYNYIRIQEIGKNYMKLIVDDNIVEVELKENLVLVKAYKLNPELAKLVWKTLSVIMGKLVKNIFY